MSQLVAIPGKQIGSVIGDASVWRDDIVAAIDFLVSVFRRIGAEPPDLNPAHLTQRNLSAFTDRGWTVGSFFLRRCAAKVLSHSQRYGDYPLEAGPVCGQNCGHSTQSRQIEVTIAPPHTANTTTEKEISKTLLMRIIAEIGRLKRA